MLQRFGYGVFLVFLLGLAGKLLVASTPVSAALINGVEATAKVFCLPAAASAPAGYYISTGIVAASANAATSVEETDGTAYYVTNIAAVSGALAPTTSCPQFYTTKQ
jgi:hypothetical protein